MYVIRKYVRATSASAAIRKDRITAVHDVWVEDTFRNEHLAEAIGFNADAPEESEYEIEEV